MARFNAAVESVTALSATSPPSGSSANQLFANIKTTAQTQFKLRRMTLGVRAGTGAPTSQQVSLAMVRTTAGGTATNTIVGNKMDPNGATSNVTLDYNAWTTVPTAASWSAPYLFEVSFNTQSGVDLPWELLEEWLVTGASNTNGIAFINVGNALPTSHLYTMALEWEE